MDQSVVLELYVGALQLFEFVLALEFRVWFMGILMGIWLSGMGLQSLLGLGRTMVSALGLGRSSPSPRRTTDGNYGSSNRYSGGRNTINTRPSSTGNKYTPGSSSSKQPIMRETNSNRGRTRIGTSSGNSTYNRPSGTTNRRSTYTPGSSSGRTSGSSSRVRNSSGGRSTYTPSSSQRRESRSSYSPSTSRSSGSSGSVGRSSGGSRGRTR